MQKCKRLCHDALGFVHKDLPWDEDEQATFYESCLEAFYNKMVAGFFWWDWSIEIYETREKP